MMTAKTFQAKQTLNNVFIIFVVALMILPFLTTFNEFLTRIAENSFLYKPIQSVVVPYEVALVRTILSIFGVETPTGTVSVFRGGVNYATYIAWNCIGWQSFVILLVSFKAGFSGNFTKMSQFWAMVFGILGTFFINIFRISAALIVLYYFGKMPFVLFHDYTSVLLSILWLFFFWWFSYSFVLEEKQGKVLLEN